MPQVYSAIYIRWHLYLEISLRCFLWFLFVFFDNLDPFIREIKEEEAWKYKYPVTESYVPGTCLWTIILSLPAVLLLMEYGFTRKLYDQISACLAISLAYSLNGILTSYIKILIGRPRPNFIDRCFPNGHGKDYKQCNGVRHSYMDGRKSFPSGHSSFAFCCMVFIILYMDRKIKPFVHSKAAEAVRLCVLSLPLIGAVTIAISRTCDYHHHYEDVIAGSLLGSLIAYISFRLYFPKTVDNEHPDE